MNNRIVTSACVLCAMLFAIQRASAQGGSLIPPGTPAPTMITLNQIEPRTPITNTTAVTISASGSYYLTANITVTNGSAITITASQVTLDLNGFTLSSTEASPIGTGILLAGGNTDITILNGHIKGGITYSGGVYSGNGFAYGINYSGSIPLNVLVSRVSVSGCQLGGILLANNVSIVVESCTVQTIKNYGIVAASVSHSVAYQCGIIAISARTASDCYGSATLSGNGLIANAANNCFGQGENNTGLSVDTANNCFGLSTGSGPALSATTANNCIGQNNGSGTGLNANNIAIGCYGSSSSGTGLVAFIANSCSGSGTPNYAVVNKYNMP
jgi:hypothetical protein